MQHADKTPDQIKHAFQERFGHGWRIALADAMSVSRTTISEWTPKLALTCALILDLLDQIPVSRWPDRWSALADLAKQQNAKRKKRDAA